MRWLLLIIATACGSNAGDDGSVDAGGDARADSSTDGSANVALPPVNAKADYQLGGPYMPPSGVTVVSRDRTAAHALDVYNICHINGFQIQPTEESYWLTNHPDLILRDGNGTPVRDTRRNEMLLDIRLAEQRSALGGIIGRWITACSDASYDAIEIDNLDSYTRSQGLLTDNQAVLMMQALSAAAHKVNRAIAQKNAPELAARRAELGTDFAVAEQCNRYSECAKYTAGYGDHVIMIEYRRQDFDAGCTAFPKLSIVLRDATLVTPPNAAYVYDGC